MGEYNGKHRSRKKRDFELYGT